MSSNSTKRYFTEFFGTYILVLLGCGSAILAGPDIGTIGVAFAFGLTLTFLIYSLGPVSGCHLNPAVSIAMVISGKLQFSQLPGYILGQLAGAAAAGFTLLTIAKGYAGFSLEAGFALNGYGDHSPDNYTLIPSIIVEAISVAILIYVLLATTKKNFASGFAGLVAGVTLTVLHLFAIPVTNASLNIARSFGVAVVHKGWALEQLWVFAVAHILAIVIALVFYRITQED